MKFFSFVCTLGLTFIATVHASNTAEYTVVVYNDAQHHDEAHAFLDRNLHHFIDLPADPVEAQKKRKEYSIKRHFNLNKGKPSNPFPPVEGSFHRMLLHHQKTLAGM